TNTYGRLAVNTNATAGWGDTSTNASSASVHYIGKFLDKHLIADVSGGWYGSPFKNVDKTIDGVSQFNTPFISWRSSQRLQNFDPSVAAACPSIAGNPIPAAGAPVGCYVQNYGTGGYGFISDLKQNRYAGNASLTALFNGWGQHQLKLGAQIDYSTYEDSRFYSGGVAWRGYGRATFIQGPGATTANSVNAFYMYRGFGTVLNPLTPGTLYPGSNWQGAPGNLGGIDPTQPAVRVASSNTWSNGYYLQDSWTIANVLTLNFGVRWDTQQMRSPSAEAEFPTTQTLSITDMVAPRVQAVWDFTGNGRGKVQGNWGRYYESIPLDAALRGFGAEQQITGAYRLSSCSNTDPKGQVLSGTSNSSGNPASACKDVYGVAAGQGPGPNTVTLGANSGLGLAPGFNYTSAGGAPLAPDLKGQYTEQFGGGIEYEIIQDLSIGVDYIGRRIGRIIEDMSSNDGVSYFIANPTVSNSWTQQNGPYAGTTLNAKQAAGTDINQGTTYAVNWPAPKRSYDGFTVKMNKLFSRGWLAQVSYTYSVLQGNFPGLFRTENLQLDPNVTSEYDLVSLLGNKMGPLAGNRSNVIKAYGSYTTDLSPTVLVSGGVAFTALEGIPVSVLGGHPIYGAGESYILSRGFAGNLPWTLNLDLQGSITWAISGPYSLRFSLDLFNVANSTTIQGVDANYTFDLITPIQGATCTNKNSITQKDSGAALLANCPDLPYARTPDNLRVARNLNYGQPTAYQNPIRARFGVQLSF
ncbi:MAG: TonB-dependent receptor, partial [Deltaproteobacteria bacterium]|nr:TonB-dependent receptor [Deltaproteobacteria bacterium]